MDLVLPVAGRSSRFPNMRPKWLLTQPDGKLMVISAIMGLPIHDFNNIYLIVLREHLEKYRCEEGIKKAFEEIGLLKKLSIVVLDEPTKNQPETVYQALKMKGVTGSFFIKDSDNYFETGVPEENSVSIFNLKNIDSVNPGNKSYVLKNEEGVITNIVEKSIISSEFCCGGYTFKSAQDFIGAYETLKDHSELYLSHLIFYLIVQGHIFLTNEASNYQDWGTLKDWNRYKSSFASIFIDIDGVLVKNSGKYFEPTWGTTDEISSNVRLINELHDTGRAEIILTTARGSEFEEITSGQLDRIGIKYHRLIMDLMHCQRIIVNDFADTNTYPSCSAINIKRNDSSHLRKMLDAIMEY